MLKKILPYLLMLFMAVPALAFAGPLGTETIHPVNGNVWTLYVFGNGDAIFHIMESIKLLMVPDNGDTGFNSLLMFLATVGFLVLAIQAGFDPGKNLMKMFSYIIVIASVHMMTMSVTANIRIRDNVTNYDNVVPGVPALVGVPAALISEIGQWFTKTIETYYNIPSEMTVSGGAFNLFGRLMQESNEFVISNPELKKSLSAYTADCVVPAMAQGRLSASELMTSAVMATTLEKASHKAIMTKYWPTGTPSTTGTGVSYVSSISYDGDDYPVQGGLGAVLPCAGAWQELSKAMNQHAEELMSASARQWSKTGVLVPFETAMSSAMAMASNGGANAFGNYSKPQGYILQQAMLNSMNGSFRSAAASMGNNDVLMAASISQAEQSQKTSWFTAARVFTNMMGYVYTTLQAFIFAIVPVVIIALMVPGLGKSIFVNYSQILVWLMLWQPMLSIVNYLITLFGQAQIASTLELAAGVTMQNKYIMTENTNDLMLAAQFLGTSVPLLTWGLVKGSLAFTEFISHGIGSSMAQQAGVTAATGNMSMNNMSMDNASMNKFNTAMSSAVGAQTTMGYTGSSQSVFDSGGHAQLEMGGAQTKVATTGLNVSQSAQVGDSANFMEQASKQMQHAKSLSADNKFGQHDSEIRAATSSAMDNVTSAWGAAKSSGDSKSMEKAAAAAIEVANSAATQVQVATEAGVRVSSDKAVIGKVLSLTTGIAGEASLKGGMSASAASNLAEKASKSDAFKEGHDVKTGTSLNAGGGNTLSEGRTATNQTSAGRDRTYTEAQQIQMSEAFGSAASKAHAVSMSLSATASQGVQSSQYVRVSDADVAGNDVAGGHGRGSVEARAGELFAQSKAELGAPVSGSSLQAMTDSAKAGIASSDAQKAPGMIASHPLNTGAPAAAHNPTGANVREMANEGHAKAEATITAANAPLVNKEAGLAKEYEKREKTGALAYGGKRMGAKIDSIAHGMGAKSIGTP